VGVKPTGKEYSQPFEVTDPTTNKTVLVRQDKEGNITPVPGGYAPKSIAAPLGSREMVFVKRIILSGNEAARDLNNVVKLPLTASTGVLGGRTQGAGLMDAGKEVLANKMTGEEAQTYNVMSTGFQRSLAAIEAAGLMPTGSLTHQMDTVLFKEGDTNYTKLMKLAQTRQIVEAGLESTISDPRVPEEVRASTRQIMAKMEKSVPFTVENLIDLKQKQAIDSNVTLKDVIKAQSAASATLPNGWSVKVR
jgi:hypothetical protein